MHFNWQLRLYLYAKIFWGKWRRNAFWNVDFRNVWWKKNSRLKWYTSFFQDCPCFSGLFVFLLDLSGTILDGFKKFLNIFLDFCMEKVTKYVDPWLFLWEINAAANIFQNCKIIGSQLLDIFIKNHNELV